MRRIVLLASLAAVLTGLAVAAVGLAVDRPATRSADAPSDRSAAADGGPFAHAASERVRRHGRHGRHGGHGRRWHRRHGHGGFHARVLGDLAERLDVSRRRLRSALRVVVRGARRDGIHPRTATPDQRAALKRRLAADLAGRLGTTPERVVAAVRGELVDGLRLAVAVGAVTERGRDLALACFDAPASCDLAALRAEVRGRRHRRPR